MDRLTHRCPRRSACAEALWGNTYIHLELTAVPNRLRFYTLFWQLFPFWATAAQNGGVRGYVRGHKILRRSNLKKVSTSVHAPGAGLQALEVWGHLETMVKCEVFLHLQVNTKEPTLYTSTEVRTLLVISLCI